MLLSNEKIKTILTVKEQHPQKIRKNNGSPWKVEINRIIKKKCRKPERKPLIGDEN